MQAIELTRMIVVDEKPAPERGVAERDAVDEQQGRGKRTTHG
jgi:hypothetical protein